MFAYLCGLGGNHFAKRHFIIHNEIKMVPFCVMLFARIVRIFANGK